MLSLKSYQMFILITYLSLHLSQNLISFFNFIHTVPTKKQNLICIRHTNELCSLILSSENPKMKNIKNFRVFSFSAVGKKFVCYLVPTGWNTTR